MSPKPASAGLFFTALTVTGSLLVSAPALAANDAPFQVAQAVKEDPKDQGKGKGRGKPPDAPQKGGPPPTVKKEGPPPFVKKGGPPPFVKKGPPPAVVKRGPPPAIVKNPPPVAPKVVVPPKSVVPPQKPIVQKPFFKDKSPNFKGKGPNGGPPPKFTKQPPVEKDPPGVVKKDDPFRNDGAFKKYDLTRKPPPPGPKFTGKDRLPKAAPWQFKNINQVKGQRKEIKQGNRIVIEEPDRRRIFRENGKTFIRHDENERFRRQWKDTRVERRGGLDVSVTVLPGGFRLYTEYDNERRPLRRYRRGPDGRDVVLFDNRSFYRRHRGPDWYRYAFVTLPPLALSIPRRQYIVEYDDASPEDIYGALEAPPLGDLDRRYSLEEIRYSPSLRDRMRRVDLSSINFEFGSWEIDEGQYRKLERMADAINRIIERDSSEVFLIEGHTDAVGDDEDNLTLSDRRAESVALVLTQEFGIPSENMTTQGYGEENLKVPTDGPEAANRYVAVRRITPLLER